MTVDVLGYLQGKGIQTKRGTRDEVHVPCFYCVEDEGKRGRLYINTDPAADIPGLHHCKLCGEKGSLVKIKRHFGDVDDEKVQNDDDHRRNQMMQAASAYYHERLLDQPVVYDWLRTKRGLTLETIVDHELGWADGGIYNHLRGLGFRTVDIVAAGLCVEDKRAGRVVDSLVDMVAIPYHVAGNAVAIRGRSFPYKGDFTDEELTALGYTRAVDGPKYKTPSGQNARLFNSSIVWESDELFVAEGEFDALVLTQHGFAAVGVPGANSWQDTWDSYVADTKRLYACFDNDTAGIEGGRKLKERFGPKVRVVEMPQPIGGKKMDPTNFFVTGHTVEEFRELLEDADATGLLVTVDQAAAAHAEMDTKTGVQLGVEDLDNAISPGFLPTQLMITIAKTGAGKTIWCLNTMQRMAMVQPDVRFLFVSLEQTRWEWFERARRIFRFYNPYATDDDVLDFWRPRLMLVDKNRVSGAELESVVDDYEYRVGATPDVLMLDYLGYWARGFTGERYERTSEAVMALKEFAKDRGLRIAAPHQVSRTTKFGEEPDADAGRDSGVIEETADFMFTLWSSDHMMPRSSDDEPNKTGEINMRIGKSRSGGRGAKVKFQFAPMSLALVPHVYQADAMNGVWLQRARDELIYDRQDACDWRLAQLWHRDASKRPPDLQSVMAPASRTAAGPAPSRSKQQKQFAMAGS